MREKAVVAGCGNFSVQTARTRERMYRSKQIKRKGGKRKNKVPRGDTFLVEVCVCVRVSACLTHSSRMAPRVQVFVCRESERKVNGAAVDTQLNKGQKGKAQSNNNRKNGQPRTNRDIPHTRAPTPIKDAPASTTTA